MGGRRGAQLSAGQPPPAALWAVAAPAALLAMLSVSCGEAPAAEYCTPGSGCVLRNIYGTFTDRLPCRMSVVEYPTTETELIAAVAYASEYNLKVKVVSRFISTIPKWTCPGGEDGLVISTRDYKSISVDAAHQTATVDAGVQLRDLLDTIAGYGLALHASPSWDGVSIAGLIGTGSHGSSLLGKGGAVHDYILNMSLVVPATQSQGWATVLHADPDSDILAAARVHLGVLGAVSKITLQLEPIFKRSVTVINITDISMEDTVLDFASSYAFASLNWWPALNTVFFEEDSRVPIETPGNDSYTFPVYAPLPDLEWEAVRMADNNFETSATGASQQCSNTVSIQYPAIKQGTGFNVTSGTLFSYPAVGFQHRMQSSGGCQLASDTPVTIIDLSNVNIAGITGFPSPSYRLVCPWDPRVAGAFFFETSISIPLRLLPDYIRTIKQLSAAKVNSTCGIGIYGGFHIDFAKASSALLGEPVDAAIISIQYYRATNASTPRLNQDIIEEIEQIGLNMFGGRPQWGKNRDGAFEGAASKFPNMARFLAIRNEVDPRGLFSSTWSQAVLNLSEGSVNKYYNGCAMEGVCIPCQSNNHCNPAQGSLCLPGLVYSDARVCRVPTTATA
eukprot:SM000139S00095  [mRNA]  locus=s139:178875:182905:+ [translate_table: standard]